MQFKITEVQFKTTEVRIKIFEVRFKITEREFKIKEVQFMKNGNQLVDLWQINQLVTIFLLNSFSIFSTSFILNSLQLF